MPLPQRYPFPVAVHAEDLACRRGGRPVFAGVSFTAEPGQILALTGPNGSGKSSLLRMLAGLIRPDAGRFRIGAGEATGERTGGGLHYLGHLDALKPALTLAETLRFWAVLSGPGTPGEDDLASAAGEVGLAHALDFPTGILSAGQRRRAGLARLLVAAEPLWLLDEPASALDAAGEALLGDLMRRHLQAGGTVIAATHGPLPVPERARLEFGGSD